MQIELELHELYYIVDIFRMLESRPEFIENDWRLSILQKIKDTMSDGQLQWKIELDELLKKHDGAIAKSHPEWIEFENKWRKDD